MEWEDDRTAEKKAVTEEKKEDSAYSEAAESLCGAGACTGGMYTLMFSHYKKRNVAVKKP